MPPVPRKGTNTWINITVTATLNVAIIITSPSIAREQAPSLIPLARALPVLYQVTPSHPAAPAAEGAAPVVQAAVGLVVVQAEAGLVVAPVVVQAAQAAVGLVAASMNNWGHQLTCQTLHTPVAG